MWRFSVPDCPQRGTTATKLWRRFAFCHQQDMVRIDGRCLPRCRVYDIQTPRVNTKHLAFDNCKDMRALCKHQEVAGQAEVAACQWFQACEWDPTRDLELRNIKIFKCLGRVVANKDYDMPAIWRNLKRARPLQGHLSKVITKESVPPRVAGMFYKAVVAAVLLYSSKTWCLPAMARQQLEGFHCEAARQLTSMRPKQVKGVCECTHTLSACCGLQGWRRWSTRLTSAGTPLPRPSATGPSWKSAGGRRD